MAPDTAMIIRKRIEAVKKGQLKKFRCYGVSRDHRRPHRIRILCCNTNELQATKKAVTATGAEGERFLRDQLYPMKAKICHGISRNVFSYKETKKRGNHAQEGPHWYGTSVRIPRYAVCQGPHPVTSRSCAEPHER